MAQLNLRNIPEDLVRLLHIAAAESGRTLRAQCILCLKAGLEKKP